MQIQEFIELDGEMYPHLRDATPEEEAEAETAHTAEEIEQLKQQLADTDYKAIKYAEGWYTKAEYAPIKAEREALRERIRELENEIELSTETEEEEI